MKNLLGLIFLFLVFDLFGQTIEKLEILDLSTDTTFLSEIQRNKKLIIKAYFPDCGEFGGHVESVTIYRENEKLKSNIKIFKKICEPNQYMDFENEEYIIEQTTNDLNDFQILQIKKYLLAHLIKSLQENQVTHADFVYDSYLTIEHESYEIEGMLKIKSRGFDRWLDFENLLETLKQ